jgi:hypothetical protein
VYNARSPNGETNAHRHTIFIQFANLRHICIIEEMNTLYKNWSHRCQGDYDFSSRFIRCYKYGQGRRSCMSSYMCYQAFRNGTPIRIIIWPKRC